MDAQRLATPENLDGQPTLPLPAARLGAPGPLGGGRLRPRPMGAAMIQPFFRAAYLLALITWDGLEDLSLVFLSPRWASERASEASHVAQPYSRRSSSEQSILPYSHHFNGAELVSRAVRPPQLLPTSLPCRVRPQPHAAPRRRRPCSSLIGAERRAEKQRAASADAVRAHVVRRTDRDN